MRLLIHLVYNGDMEADSVVICRVFIFPGDFISSGGQNLHSESEA